MTDEGQLRPPQDWMWMLSCGDEEGCLESQASAVPKSWELTDIPQVTSYTTF